MAALLLTLLGAAGVAGQDQVPETTPARFDVLIVGGRVLDGSGNPWFRADVGVRGDRVAAVGALDGTPAGRVVDARGKLVLPGFIDIHSHGDDGARTEGGFRDPDPARRAAPNLVAQGVTTVVVNHDGRSPWPIAAQRDHLRREGIGPNAALLVGHGRVRHEVMGTDHRRAARPEEIARMRELVARAMDEGAYGLSAGLEYVPGRWSDTDEVVALVEEIAPFGGVYISHERSEGSDPMWYWPSRDGPAAPTLLDALRETVEVGERTGVVVVASHIKAKGAHYWGASGDAIRLIQDARDRGVSVYADQYPYRTSGSDGNTVLIPEWVFPEGRPDRRSDAAGFLRRALADPATAERVRGDVAHEISRRGGAGNVVVFEYPDTAYVGRTLAELAAERGVSPVEMAFALQLEGFTGRPGGARVRGFSMTESDLEAFARQPWTATASDAGVALPTDGPVHARYYGTFPRKLRRYALERDVISLEEAVRSMTSLPAQIMGFRDRGTLREGAAADLVVLDPARIEDRATFFEPHRFPAGIDHVLVNGVFVVDGGQPTLALPGRVLTPATDGSGRRIPTEAEPLRTGGDR